MVAQVLDAPATIQAVTELLQKVKQSALLFNCFASVHHLSLSPSLSVRARARAHTDTDTHYTCTDAYLHTSTCAHAHMWPCGNLRITCRSCSSPFAIGVLGLTSHHQAWLQVLLPTAVVWLRMDPLGDIFECLSITEWYYSRRVRRVGLGGMALWSKCVTRSGLWGFKSCQAQVLSWPEDRDGFHLLHAWHHAHH